MNAYTRTAITILEKMKQEVGPALLAYWVTPNTILSLSGVRAYCDGVNWSDEAEQLEKWRQEIEQAYTVLQKYADIFDGEVKTEEVRPQESYTGYDIVFRPGLRKVLQDTAIIQNVDDVLREAHDIESLQDALSKAIKANPAYATLSNDDIGHMAFGIIVGYPDAAILGLIYETDRRKDPFAERSINADIRGADYYACPQPVYDYPRHLVTDPVITAHEQLWSSILREYYLSDFHKQLEADASFHDKLIELGMVY